MIPTEVRIFVCSEPVDMRCGFDRLALLARERVGDDPQSGALFVFCGKRATRLKVLWFDQQRILFALQAFSPLSLQSADGTRRVRANRRRTTRTILQGCSRRARKSRGDETTVDRDRGELIHAAVSDDERIAALKVALDAPRALARALERERDEYKKLYRLLLEENEKLKRGLTGKQAEKLPKTDAQLTLSILQMLLGNGDEPTARATDREGEQEAETTEVTAHVRKKSSGRAALDDFGFTRS